MFKVSVFFLTLILAQTGSASTLSTVVKPLVIGCEDSLNVRAVLELKSSDLAAQRYAFRQRAIHPEIHELVVNIFFQSLLLSLNRTPPTSVILFEPVRGGLEQVIFLGVEQNHDLRLRAASGNEFTLTIQQFYERLPVPSRSVLALPAPPLPVVVDSDRIDWETKSIVAASDERGFHLHSTYNGTGISFSEPPPVDGELFPQSYYDQFELSVTRSRNLERQIEEELYGDLQFPQERSKKQYVISPNHSRLQYLLDRLAGTPRAAGFRLVTVAFHDQVPKPLYAFLWDLGYLSVSEFSDVAFGYPYHDLFQHAMFGTYLFPPVLLESHRLEVRFWRMCLAHPELSKDSNVRAYIERQLYRKLMYRLDEYSADLNEVVQSILKKRKVMGALVQEEDKARVLEIFEFLKGRNPRQIVKELTQKRRFNSNDIDTPSFDGNRESSQAAFDSGILSGMLTEVQIQALQEVLERFESRQQNRPVEVPSPDELFAQFLHRLHW